MMNPFWSVTAFWIAAVVCVAVALAFVLPPLLRRKQGDAAAARRDLNIAVYRDQMREMQADRDNGLLAPEQFETAKAELEARLAEDALASETPIVPVAAGARKTGFALAALLPIAAFGLYFLVGNPLSLTAIAEAQANPQAVQGEHDIMKMIQKVEEKTRQDPNDAQAWSILAKTYAAVGHWPEALNAYDKAFKLKPDVPAIMTGYAEALAISQNRVLEGKPIELVMAALAKDPEDLKGLELAGIHAFQTKGYAKAAYYMKQLYKLLPPESPYAQDILNAQKEAEKLVQTALTGMDNLADPKAGKTAAPGATISGEVDISPALKAKVGVQDVLFLFAKSAAGGPPVAAIRAQAGKFPLTFELNDSMAMNPQNTLSKAGEVTLTARVSKSGQPSGGPGDLEGSVKAVKVGAKGVKIVIDTVRR